MSGPWIKINKTTCRIFYKETSTFHLLISSGWKLRSFSKLFLCDLIIFQMIYLLQKYFPFRHPFPLPCLVVALHSTESILFLFRFTFLKIWQKLILLAKWVFPFFFLLHWRIKSVFRLIWLMNLPLFWRITFVEYDCSVREWSKMVERENTEKILKTKRSNQCRVVTTTTTVLLHL